MDTKIRLEREIQALTNCGEYEAATALHAMEWTLSGLIYSEWIGWRGTGGDTPPESLRNTTHSMSFWLLNLCAGPYLTITHDESKPLGDKVLAWLHQRALEIQQASA